jgi:hypothetical protein
MGINITIQVPSDLAHRLRPYQKRLPELLERGLQSVAIYDDEHFHDENQIMEVLTSNPTPEQVLALRPSVRFQARVSELLERNKQGTLSRHEEAELERYLFLEHLVRLAKTHAAQHLDTVR